MEEQKSTVTNSMNSTRVETLASRDAVIYPNTINTTVNSNAAVNVPDALGPNSVNNVPDAVGPNSVNNVHELASNSVIAEARSEAGGSVVKRGRGRPRKNEADQRLASPLSAPPGFAAHPIGSTEKRGRGRPRGSGKLQIMASAGIPETAGGSITTHVLTVETGEDVVSKILSFFQGPRAVCILSTTGVVSSVAIRHPNASGGVETHKGQFEILSLSGACVYRNGLGGIERGSGMLTVTLAKPDGNVFGGGIDGSLIAAGPIQLVIATFKQSNGDQTIKRRNASESSNALNMPENPESGGGRDNNKIPKLMDGEQSCPLPTSGLKPTTTTDVVPENVIPVATSEVPENAIPVATSNGMPENVTPADQNMHSDAVNGVDVNVPQI